MTTIFIRDVVGELGIGIGVVIGWIFWIEVWVDGDPEELSGLMIWRSVSLGLA